MSYDPVPGMRVVCIDSPWNPDLCVHLPKVGAVYTIRHVGPRDDDGDFPLRFHELINPDERAHGGEWWFQARFFRPLDERRLDVFREALKMVEEPA